MVRETVVLDASTASALPPTDGTAETAGRAPTTAGASLAADDSARSEPAVDGTPAPAVAAYSADDSAGAVETGWSAAVIGPAAVATVAAHDSTRTFTAGGQAARNRAVVRASRRSRLTLMSCNAC